MHPDNVFGSATDFGTLCEKYPRLKAVCKRTKDGKQRCGVLDWSNDRTVYELSKALLAEQFQIEWGLANWGDDEFDSVTRTSSNPRNLVPAVPRTVNYLCWVKDLLAHSFSQGLFLSSEQHVDGCKMLPTTVGIDVGTGASCVFCLIGCKLSSNWDFIGTEIDPNSVQFARQLVDRNNLKDRIHVRASKTSEFLSSVLEDNKHRAVGFSVCNPPFFDSYNKSTSAERPSKRLRVSMTDFHGTDSEKSYEGLGEVPFFKRLFQDTWLVCDIWFTCMFGHKASLVHIIDWIDKERDKASVAPNLIVQTTALKQGQKTRWCIGWRFSRTDHHKEENCVLARISAREFCQGPMNMATSCFHITADILPAQVWERTLEFLGTRTPKLAITFADNQVAVGKESIIKTGATSPAFSARCYSSDGSLYFYLEISASSRVSLTHLLHSDAESKKRLHALGQQLEGDIVRTNRRWRRLLAKQGQ